MINEKERVRSPRAKKRQVSVLSQFRGYSLLIVLSVIWGLAFVAIRVADTQLTPVNLTLIRWLIAGAGYLVLAPFFAKPEVKFEIKDLPRLLVISFANVPGYHLSLNYAEISISAGLAGLLISLGPVFIVLLSAISLKEKIGKRIILALLVASAGAAVLAISNFGSGSSFWGLFLVVLTAISYALFAVLSKPLVQKYGALPMAIWAGTIGTTMLLPLISNSFIAQLGTISNIGLLSVLYLSILSTVLGYMMYYTLVSRGALSKLSIQLYLIPVVSVIGGAILLQEQITIFTVIGGAALLLSVALATRAKE